MFGIARSDLAKVTVPEFSHRMASSTSGPFKCRFVRKKSGKPMAPPMVL
jgi:hypothetical protein